MRWSSSLADLDWRVCWNWSLAARFPLLQPVRVPRCCGRRTNSTSAHARVNGSCTVTKWTVCPVVPGGRWPAIRRNERRKKGFVGRRIHCRELSRQRLTAHERGRGLPRFGDQHAGGELELKVLWWAGFALHPTASSRGEQRWGLCSYRIVNLHAGGSHTHLEKFSYKIEGQPAILGLQVL